MTISVHRREKEMDRQSAPEMVGNSLTSGSVGGTGATAPSAPDGTVLTHTDLSPIMISTPTLLRGPFAAT